MNPRKLPKITSDPDTLCAQLLGESVITPYDLVDYSRTICEKAVKLIADSGGKLSLNTLLEFDRDGKIIKRTVLQFLAHLVCGRRALAKYPALLIDYLRYPILRYTP